jgi:uridine phosphorylase
MPWRFSSLSQWESPWTFFLSSRRPVSSLCTDLGSPPHMNHGMHRLRGDDVGNRLNPEHGRYPRSAALIMNPEPAIIEPQKGKRDPDLPHSAVLVFTPHDFEYAVNLLREHKGEITRIYLTHVHAGSYGDAQMAIAGPMLGAPQAVLVLEKMIALGVHRVLALGWCGSLQPHVRIGDVVIPRGAVSEEGTSPHYPIGIGKPGPTLAVAQHLIEVLRTEGKTFHEGHVWSTDAPYRETVKKVQEYQKQGVLAVDMEISALFTVAHFRGIELAAVLAVSDELHDLSWRHGFREPRFKQGREYLCRVALETLSRMVTRH